MSNTQVSGGDVNKQPQGLINGSAAATATKTGSGNRPTSSKKMSKTNVNRALSQKSPEDMQDEIMELKKSIGALAEENTTLKAKARRVEEDNLRKDKQIGDLLDPNKNEELKRVLADKKSSSTNVVVNNLKHKVFKLEQLVKEKDAALKKLEGDSQSSKVHEMKIQMDAYYREIIRLKNLNNLRETARTTNEDSIQQVLLANKELEEENSTLRKDLERALAIENLQKQEDYMTMSKTHLIGIITDLENKLQSAAVFEQKAVDPGLMSVDALKVELAKQKQEEQLLQVELQKVKEDRLHYRGLVENRDQELKALRLLIEHMQKQVDTKPSSAPGSRKTSSAASKPPRSPPSLSEPSTAGSKPGGSVFERLTQLSPRNMPNVTRTATKTNSTSSGTNVNASAKTKPAKPAPASRTSPKSPKPLASASTQMTKDASKTKTSIPRSSASSPKSSSSAQPSTLRQIPTNKSQVKDEPKASSKVNQSSLAAKKRKAASATKMVQQEVPNVSSSATTYIVADAALESKRELPIAESISSDNAGTQNTANKTVTYTVLQTLNVTTDVPEVKQKKSSPRANDKQIQDFRQKVAAKKIQKMWKHHQTETVVQNQRRRVHNFQQNRAARTIQRGWKKHSQQRVDVSRNPHDQVNGEPLIDFSSMPVENTAEPLVDLSPVSGQNAPTASNPATPSSPLEPKPNFTN